MSGHCRIIPRGGCGSGQAVNRSAVLAWRPGQVQVPADPRADVSAHGFWNQGTTAMFDIRIFNLDVGSYLLMTLKMLLQRRRKKRRTCTFRLAWSVNGLLLQWSTLQTEYIDLRR